MVLCGFNKVLNHSQSFLKNLEFPNITFYTPSLRKMLNQGTKNLRVHQRLNTVSVPPGTYSPLIWPVSKKEARPLRVKGGHEGKY